jgi:hypothetical protein
MDAVEGRAEDVVDYLLSMNADVNHKDEVCGVVYLLSAVYVTVMCAVGPNGAACGL